jgi:hypothetical protein
VIIRELFKLGEVLQKNKTFLEKNRNLLYSFTFYSDFNIQQDLCCAFAIYSILCVKFFVQYIFAALM